MDEFNHVTIVEPHGDDALISSCTALEALPTFSTTLITLSERPSYNLIEYFDSLKAGRYKNLEDLNYKYRPKINTHEIHRMYESDVNIVAHICSLIMRDVPPSLYRRAATQVNSVLDYGNPSDTNILLLPLGLDHPYHLLVSSYKPSRPTSIIYYLEKPYLSKRYIREYVNQYCRYDISLAHLIVEYTESLKSKKSKVFKTVYPTEQSLLRFTRQSILEDPDEYLVPVSMISEVQAMFHMAGFNTYIEKDGKYYENFDSCQPKSST